MPARRLRRNLSPRPLLLCSLLLLCACSPATSPAPRSRLEVLAVRDAKALQTLRRDYTELALLLAVREASPGVQAQLRRDLIAAAEDLGADGLIVFPAQRLGEVIGLDPRSYRGARFNATSSQVQTAEGDIIIVEGVSASAAERAASEAIRVNQNNVRMRGVAIIYPYRAAE